MVQGGLLTAHPGGVHGDGWSPGGGSSFRQGAGTASPGSPDLETAAAAIQRRVRESLVDIRGFHTDGDPPVSQEGPWRGPGWGHATCPAGWLGVALLRSFGDSGSFCCADFLYIFPGILGVPLMAGKPKIQKKQKTETGNWVH